MRILVCGGAGYIGSHMIKMLHEYDHSVVTFDNLSTGHEHAVQWGELIHGDLLNTNDLNKLLDNNRFDAVMHFAALSLVGESMRNPAAYYQNNILGTFNLLEAIRKHNINKFIFSSSAAVYGKPQFEKIDERHPTKPINPYGQTKLMVEHILRDYAAAYGMSSVSLRYFNAAGADPSGAIGENHNPETHLIPNIIKAILDQSRDLQVFGDDYDTHDGTCIRDYIHVTDLCSAHLKALDYLFGNPGCHQFNLGNGNGFSIKEVIEAAEQITSKKISYTIAARRPGDPAKLVADATLALEHLHWKPEYTDIKSIILTALNYYKMPHV